MRPIWSGLHWPASSFPQTKFDLPGKMLKRDLYPISLRRFRESFGQVSLRVWDKVWLSTWVLCYASFGNHSPFLVFDMMCLVAVVLIWQLCAEIQLVKFSTVVVYLSQKHLPYLSLISSISSLTVSYLCLSGEFLADDAWEFKELEEDIVKGYM